MRCSTLSLSIATLSLAGALAGLGACESGEITGDVAGYVDDGEIPTFREFEELTFREEGDEGVYIVNGDTPIVNEKQLREYYDALFTQQLIVQRYGGNDAKWDQSTRRNLTYCVSNNFGNYKGRVVQAMEEAAAAWERAADVDFRYVPAQDGNCTRNNNNVLFDVQPTQGAPYLARAFFPGQNRGSRNVIVDLSTFGSGWGASAILAHELGHVLGFRHEHTRPESGACFEDNNWRPLTPYDRASIMHYPQCNGRGFSLSFSQTDFSGVAQLYGRPGSGGTPTPTNEKQSASTNGTLTKGQAVNYDAIPVAVGSTFKAVMQGSGDADLYIRFNAEPEFNAFHCRPYVNGSNEGCALDVPQGATTAYISVYGYTASQYQLAAEWVEP